MLARTTENMQLKMQVDGAGEIERAVCLGRYRVLVESQVPQNRRSRPRSFPRTAIAKTTRPLAARRPVYTMGDVAPAPPSQQSVANCCGRARLRQSPLVSRAQRGWGGVATRDYPEIVTEAAAR